jgi:rhodanese-related sulfurtransferase
MRPPAEYKRQQNQQALKFYNLQLKSMQMKKLFVILLLVACGEKQTTTETSLLAPTAFNTKLQAVENALLLDVRTEEEVKTGVIDGAENIVFDENFADKLTALSDKPIFVYCAAGGRSAKAADILREKGFEVYELEGGMRAWKEAGLPVQ